MHDRKEKIREYKEAPKPPGVIRIRNSRNGKSLVEATRTPAARLNRHEFLLRQGMHRNEALVRDWKVYGAEAFTFEVLDTLTLPDEPGYDPADDLKVLEELWLERLMPFGENGYNGPGRDKR